MIPTCYTSPWGTEDWPALSERLVGFPVDPASVWPFVQGTLDAAESNPALAPYVDEVTRLRELAGPTTRDHQVAADLIQLALGAP